MFWLADNVFSEVRLFLVGNRFIDSVIGKRFAYFFDGHFMLEEC